ncbi:MAG: addiction module toxin, HicA family [bacterium]|nr:addiction module toxin, HicA family [bacterium]
MKGLPLIKRRTLEKILLHLDFKIIRQLGNHILYKHEDGRITTIVRYRGKKIAHSLLHIILHDIDLDYEHYQKLLEEIK